MSKIVINRGYPKKALGKEHSIRKISNHQENYIQGMENVNR